MHHLRGGVKRVPGGAACRTPPSIHLKARVEIGSARSRFVARGGALTLHTLVSRGPGVRCADACPVSGPRDRMETPTPNTPRGFRSCRRTWALLCLAWLSLLTQLPLTQGEFQPIPQPYRP